MTAKIRLLLMILVLPFTPAGCAAISAFSDASQPLEVYELRTPQVPRSGDRRNIEIVVEEPVASGTIATDRILIRPTPLQAQYLPGVRWADTAPVMFQTLMVRSLTETEAFGSVGRAPIGSMADLAVLSELTDFQAERTGVGDAAIIRLRVVLRLVRENDATVISTRVFEVIEEAKSSSDDAIVAAFDTASSRIISEIVQWIGQRGIRS